MDIFVLFVVATGQRELEISDEEFDDLESGQEASNSDSNHSASESEKDSDENADTEKNVVYGNFSWADSMSKVLSASKPKAKKSVILAKAKLDADIIRTMEAKEALPFEVVAEKVKPSREDSEEAVLKRKMERLEKLRRREQRREWDLMGRVVPSIVEDREKERTLSRIGTRFSRINYSSCFRRLIILSRGVVQLFNSVKIQQKTIKDKLRSAGPLEREKEKALKSIDKNDFMDLLQGKKPSKVL